jgi:hypothetical protein
MLLIDQKTAFRLTPALNVFAVRENCCFFLQNVILTSQATGGQTVVLASQALRAQGGTLVLQQGGAQQILLPPGFQGGTLNIKTLQGLQGLQGLKVIPLSQATAAASNKGEQSCDRS